MSVDSIIAEAAFIAGKQRASTVCKIASLGWTPELRHEVRDDFKELKRDPFLKGKDNESKGRRLGALAGFPLAVMQGLGAGVLLEKTLFNKALPQSKRLLGGLGGTALATSGVLAPMTLGHLGASLGKKFDKPDTEKKGSFDPIPYEPGAREKGLEKGSEEFWKEFDCDSWMTGEESALGMPTAGGVNKNAGAYPVGSVDANKGKPENYRNRYLKNAVEQAFETNEKIGNTNASLGLGTSLTPKGLGMGGTDAIKNPFKPPSIPKIKPSPLQLNVNNTAQSSGSMQSITSPANRLAGGVL